MTLQSCKLQTESVMVNFIDLFAGTGGIRLGIEQACDELGITHKCVLSSEIDKNARDIYQMNFGEYPKGDIHEVFDIPEFNFLLGGFPCQSFSYAGKQKGFGDTRGTLFFEIERLLKIHMPQAFLLENVRGLVTHDKGRTFRTIIQALENLGYGVTYLLANSSNFGVPQNRVRIYILGLLGKKPKLTLISDKGAADSHKFKQQANQLQLFGDNNYKVVRDILETNVNPKYICSVKFTNQLKELVGDNFNALNGVRLIDYRNGQSIHSWELGIKGKCTEDEIEFLNLLIANRRKKIFGAHQDGKKLVIDQIKTFYKKDNIHEVMESLIKKGYLKEVDGKYNPVAGNMSFEVFKFLDPDSISITLVSSDAHKLGVVVNNIPRRITPREAARLQGYPDSYKVHPNDIVAYRQFGNAVAVPVVKAVLVDFIENNLLKEVKNLTQNKGSDEKLSFIA